MSNQVNMLLFNTKCALIYANLVVGMPRIDLFDISNKSSMRYGSFKILSNIIYPLT